jgi:Trk K+ transport system NAD-binding subunit
MAKETDIQGLSGHLIVCGLGHVGWRVVRLLVRLGEPVVVITRETTDEWRLEDEPEFPMIIGDARQDALLRQAGIGTAKGIIIVTDDDLANVSIALDARRLNPGISIVARLADQEMAGHLETSAGIDRALSTTALAIPAFLAAALGAAAREVVEIDGTVFLVDEVAAGTDTAAGDQAVLGILRDGELLPCLVPFPMPKPGDRLVRLRIAPETDAVAVAARRKTPGMLGWLGMAAGLRGWWRELPGAFRLAILILLGIVLFSIALFHFTMGLSVVDSLYFVVTTITTTGYGDISLKDASMALKLYGTFVMLCGAAVVAALFSVFTDFLLSTRFRDVLVRGAAKTEGHVIVAGLGNVGFQLTRELLRNGEAVVAIESQETGEFVRPARELAPVIIGNAKADEILRKAGLPGAKAVVAATDDDMVNLSIGLAARRANPGCRVVLRLFDTRLAEKLPRSFGVDAVLSMSAAAAPTLAGVALCPETRQGLFLHHRLAMVFRRVVAAGSLPAGPLGKNETALFVKDRETGRYTALAPARQLQAGDEIIGIRWHPQDGKEALP